MVLIKNVSAVLVLYYFELCKDRANGRKEGLRLISHLPFYLMCKDSIFYDNCKRKAAFYFPKAT